MVPGGSPPRMKRESGENPGQYPLLYVPSRLPQPATGVMLGRRDDWDESEDLP